MSKPPKIDRKQLKNPDEFIQKGRAFLDVLAERRMVLLFAVIGIAVVVGAVEGYEWWFNERVEKAWMAYDDAMKAPEAQRWDKLKAVVDGTGAVRPNYFAKVALADHYYKAAEEALGKDANAVTQNAASAVEWYTKALDFNGLVPAERQLLFIDRGDAYELQSNADQALKDYQAASGIQGEANGYALLGEGRAWEIKKDTAKATAAYEKVVGEYAGTEYAKLAKNYLRLLKSPLFRSMKSNAS